MTSFEELSLKFEHKFSGEHFPSHPENLYKAAAYILQIGGKRLRPVLVLMCNELFDDISEDAYHVATAVELFHNFTLIHDDIMDKAPLRRGKPTVHSTFNENTAILAGDAMLIKAYEYLNKIDPSIKTKIFNLFNATALQVCEGQQLDMDFEIRNDVSFDEYENMIGLKTSVLLGASMQMGAVLGGATQGNQDHLHQFGKLLGMAFQVQDDYLDSFGKPEKFGKQVGGDIIANKKTFLFIRALETANPAQREILLSKSFNAAAEKVANVLTVYRDCGIEQWAAQLKENYCAQALQHLEDSFVTSIRKEPLRKLAAYLLQRDS